MLHEKVKVRRTDEKPLSPGAADLAGKREGTGMKPLASKNKEKDEDGPRIAINTHV